MLSKKNQVLLYMHLAHIKKVNILIVRPKCVLTPSSPITLINTHYDLSINSAEKCCVALKK